MGVIYDDTGFGKNLSREMAKKAEEAASSVYSVKSDITELHIDISEVSDTTKLTKADLEAASVVSASQFEYQAEIVRQLGWSGLGSPRGYTQGAMSSNGKKHDGSYGLMNIHNHSNYKYTVGTAELTAIINGYYVRTRHNDYHMVENTVVESTNGPVIVPSSGISFVNTNAQKGLISVVKLLCLFST